MADNAERPNDALREANQNREDIRRQFEARQRGAYVAGLHGTATRVVAEWKAKQKLDMLSPEACRQLADMIHMALIEASR